MGKSVSKVVLPVAGLGTRFLPVTKTIPKEMLPVVDKPIIQYAVEEAVNAGITEIILVNHPDKPSISSYFQRDNVLEEVLQKKDKLHLLDSLNELINTGLSVTTAMQNQPLGLGHAVLCAREVVGDETFAVILPDDLIAGGNRGCLQEMLAIHEESGSGVIAVENVPRDNTASYGIVETATLETGLKQIISIVEKPAPEEAPSTLGVVGRYILPGKIFGLLENTSTGAGGEIQLTDAIAALIETDQVVTCEFSGIRYDCGSKTGYLKANVELALADPDIKNEFECYLKNLIQY